jgi:peptidoglycan/LPS O-acetylase OafA/YrhL
MRAVAVLLVVLYHARVPIHGGLVGVDVFFVISGFIITLIPRLIAKRSRQERSRYTGWLLAGMAIVLVPSRAYSIYDTRHNPAAAYFVTGTRLWELAIGGGVAIIARHLANTPRLIAAVLTWGGVAVVIASAFVISAATPSSATSWSIATITI